MEKMSNYKFFTDFSETEDEGLTEELFLKIMRTNDASWVFDYDDEEDECYCTTMDNTGASEYQGIVRLENGCVCIEMNLLPTKDLFPVLDFCVNYEDKIGWGTDNYYGAVVVGDLNIQTDFAKDNWKEQLEKEMFNKLDKYCKIKGYDYSKPFKF